MDVDRSLPLLAASTALTAATAAAEAAALQLHPDTVLPTYGLGRPSRAYQLVQVRVWPRLRGRRFPQQQPNHIAHPHGLTGFGSQLLIPADVVGLALQVTSCRADISPRPLRSC